MTGIENFRLEIVKETFKFNEIERKVNKHGELND